MAQKTGPESFILRQCRSAPTRQLPRKFIESIGLMKPSIIIMMLDNSLCHCCHTLIAVPNQRRGPNRASPYSTVCHTQPVRHGRASQHVWIVKKSATVGEIIHLDNLE